jgi:DNA-binding NarL/FixJ family response regulator
MSQVRVNRSTDNKLNPGPSPRRPAVVLLGKRQWRYLKKRYELTAREQEVASLVCRGYSKDEIAEALDIKEGTVKTHLRNIYRRVRVKSKILLLLRFIEDTNMLLTNAAARQPDGITQDQSRLEPAAMSWED